MRAEERRASKWRKPVTSYVRCQGQWHRIKLTPRGALVLQDHSWEEIGAELVLATLGGKPCECVQVLKWWKNFGEETLPTALFEVRQERWRYGQIRRTHRGQDPLARPFLERLAEETWRAATICLEQTGYKRLNSNNPRYTHETFVWIQPPVFGSTLQCSIERESDGYHTYEYTVWNVTLSPRWLKLYRMGAALVDGIFVLGLVEKLPNGNLRVVAGKQEEGGYEINPAEAILTRRSDGWSLRWVETSVRDTRGAVLVHALTLHAEERTW